MEIIIVTIALLPFVLLLRVLLKKILGSFMDGFARDTLALAGAFGYIALLMFFLGVLNLYDARILWGIIGLHYLFSIRIYDGILQHCLIRKFTNVLHAWNQDTLLNKGLILFALILIGFNILGAYIPQTGEDALFYHFALPKLFIQHGGLYFFPYSFMSAWPFNIEMLFTFGMLLHGDTAANLLNVIIGIAFSLTIYNLVKEYLGHTQGLIWSVVSYSTPFTLAQAHKGYVDFGVGLFATAGLFLLIVAIRKKRLNPEIAILSGLFFGLAAGSKTMGAMAGVFAAMALLVCFFSQYKRQVIYYSGFIIFFTVLIASPWYIRSAVHTGNPIYPALYSVFGGKYWNNAVDERLKNVVNSPDINLAPLGRSLTGFVAAPLFMHYPRILGKWFDRGDTKWKRPSSKARTHLSYLSLIFIPFSFPFILKRKRLMRESAFLATTMLLFVVAWFFFLTQEDRYLIPLLGIIYLFSAFGLKSILEDLKNRWLRQVSIGACALWFFASLGIYGLYYVPKAYGLTDREKFLTQHSYLYKPIQWVNLNLGKDKKIALLSEMLPYYFNIPYIHIGPALRLFDYKDGQSLHHFLREQKVTHLLVTQDESGNYLHTDDRAANPNIYLFRSDSPSFEAEKQRSDTARPIEDLVSDPEKVRLVYEHSEKPVIAKTPVVLGDPVQVKIFELRDQYK